MIIKICCVGKLKESFFIDACAEYEKRLSRYCELLICEVPDEKAGEELSKAAMEQVKLKEGRRLLAKLDPKDYVVALCIEGGQQGSEEFAETLNRLMDSGTRCVAFMIGGSLGLSFEVTGRANLKLSLTKMTFPHRIARLVLEEQLCRAYKIIRNEPYHK